MALTDLPSIRTSPELMSSRPAIRRSSVDLPQPDGPTNTMNSPCAASRSMPWITGWAPKLLVTVFNSRLAIIGPRSFQPRIGDAGRDVFLEENEDQRHRQQRQHGHREQIMEVVADLALEGREPELE